MEVQLGIPDYTVAKNIYSNGVYSKPAAVCTFDTASLALLPTSISKSDEVYFLSNNNIWVLGKAQTSYTTATDLATTTDSFTFTYPVPEAAIVYPYPYASTGPNADAGGSCWVGDQPTASQQTGGCINGSTTSTTSTIVIGTGTSGASGCTAGTGQGFGTCATVTDQLTVTCTNQGKRSLRGFSTAAKAKMYDPALSSSDCPDSSVAPQSTKGYANGCPYTSFTPYWNYYCASTTSACYTNGDYANQIVTAALDGTSVTFTTSGAMDFSSTATGAANANDLSLRKEVIKKGTAYMNAWMYAIREFEDAIDDCTSGSLTANGGSSGPVHAWDEGVAFYVGSAISGDDLFSSGTELGNLGNKGFLAYTLANKRCQNYKTCGANGDSVIGEAKVNIDLWELFRNGNSQLLLGNCGDVVPIKNQIVQKMTVPLVQGTLRYAYKQSTTTPSNLPKEKGEGAVFAAAVLPQVHACSPTAAATIYANMNINNDGAVDYNAVKAAFEGCYSAMGITCAEVGGLYSSSSSSYYSATGAAATPANAATTYDASPCVDPATSSTVAVAASSDAFSGGALAGIIVGALLSVVLLVFVCMLISKEKAGKPMFYTVQPGAAKPPA